MGVAGWLQCTGTAAQHSVAETRCSTIQTLGAAVNAWGPGQGNIQRLCRGLMHAATVPVPPYTFAFNWRGSDHCALLLPRLLTWAMETRGEHTHGIAMHTTTATATMSMWL